MAQPRSRGSSRFTTLPPMAISPPEISSRPAIILRSVDFPQPEGPSTTRNSPSLTSRSMPCTISSPPKFLRRPRMLMSAIPRLLLLGRDQAAHEPALHQHHD